MLCNERDKFVELGMTMYTSQKGCALIGLLGKVALTVSTIFEYQRSKDLLSLLVLYLNIGGQKI